MTREERMRQCRYLKEGVELSGAVDYVFRGTESRYVEYGEERGPYEYEGFELYYERYGERTYRGIPYGIITRLYLYALEKGLGYADSLTKFHKFLDSYAAKAITQL